MLIYLKAFKELNIIGTSYDRHNKGEYFIQKYAF